MKRRPVLLASVLIGNVFGAVCARLAWVYAEGTLGAVFGMLFALTLFVDWCLLVQARGLAPHRPDYLTVADRYPEKHIPQGSFKGATQKQRGLWIVDQSHSVYQQKRRTS